MSTNNPMTEGEALAVLRELVLRVLASHTTEMEGYSYFSSNPGVPKDSYNEVADEIAAALAAHTAASAGEAVGEVTVRDGWDADKASNRLVTFYGDLPPVGTKLYTRPPAAVPADALERLVVEWRDQAKRLRNEVPNLRDGTDKRFDSARDADRAADELAALIPKGADHGQR